MKPLEPEVVGSRDTGAVEVPQAALEELARLQAGLRRVLFRTRPKYLFNADGPRHRYRVWLPLWAGEAAVLAKHGLADACEIDGLFVLAPPDPRKKNQYRLAEGIIMLASASSMRQLVARWLEAVGPDHAIAEAEYLARKYRLRAGPKTWEIVQGWVTDTLDRGPPA